MARKNVDEIQSAAGQISGLISDMLRIRDESGVSPEEFHVLFTPDGVPHLKKMIEGLKSPVPEIPKPVYLRQLYASEEIELDPTDGLKTIARAKEVFKLGIDGEFTNWNLDAPTQPTKAVKVSIHEMLEQDGTFAQIYGSLGHPLEKLRLTQHQIIDFCVKYEDKLRQEGYGTFFLFKVGEEYFIALISVTTGGSLLGHLYRFSDSLVWDAGYRRRFVLPQLDAQVASAS